MKGIKSYILATIMGLVGTFSANVSAKFVVNENCPHWYKQSQGFFDGIRFFRSIDDNEVNPVVWYKMIRVEKECNKQGKDRKSDDCFEYLSKDTKYFNELKKYDFYAFRLNEIKDKAKSDEFFNYLLALYNNASREGIMCSMNGKDIKRDELLKNKTILPDNPLDNMGEFFAKTEKKLSNDNSNGIFDKEENSKTKFMFKALEILLDVINPNGVFKSTIINCDANEKIEDQVNAMIHEFFISHDSNLNPSTIEYTDSLNKMKIEHPVYCDGFKEIDNLTSKFTFFSIIPKGYHDKLKSELKDRNFHFGLSNLDRIPLASVSLDLVDIGKGTIYNGPLTIALANYLTKEYKSILQRVKGEKSYKEFTRIEVRIPTYVITVNRPDNSSSWKMTGQQNDNVMWDESDRTKEKTKSSILNCYKQDKFKI